LAAALVEVTLGWLRWEPASLAPFEGPAASGSASARRRGTSEMSLSVQADPALEALEGP
jgi:hypothetical protein